MGRGLVVFSWHNIESTPAFPTRHGRGVQGFERQLRHLARFATVLPLEPALDALYAGETLPRRAVCLTFDDGYRDNLDLAVPLLRRYGLPATFFLVPAFLDQGRGAWWETLGWALGGSRRDVVEFEGTEYRLGSAAGASTERVARSVEEPQQGRTRCRHPRTRRARRTARNRSRGQPLPRLGRGASDRSRGVLDRLPFTRPRHPQPRRPCGAGRQPRHRPARPHRGPRPGDRDDRLSERAFRRRRPPYDGGGASGRPPVRTPARGRSHDRPHRPVRGAAPVRAAPPWPRRALRAVRSASR